MNIYIKRIKDLREDNDLTQMDIAKILNVSQTNYSKYERNERKLSIEQLIILCKYYGVSSDYILGFTDKPKLLPKDGIYMNGNYTDY